MIQGRNLLLPVKARVVEIELVCPIWWDFASKLAHTISIACMTCTSSSFSSLVGSFESTLTVISIIMNDQITCRFFDFLVRTSLQRMPAFAFCSCAGIGTIRLKCLLCALQELRNQGGRCYTKFISRCDHTGFRCIFAEGYKILLRNVFFYIVSVKLW